MIDCLGSPLGSDEAADPAGADAGAFAFAGAVDRLAHPALINKAPTIPVIAAVSFIHFSELEKSRVQPAPFTFFSTQ
jgi:hypothetical protein